MLIHILLINNKSEIIFKISVVKKQYLWYIVIKQVLSKNNGWILGGENSE